MLTDWHKNDIYEALRRRGWQGPNELPFSREQLYYVGEACYFQRSAESVHLHFVADIGTGFHGEKSIESVVASFEGDPALYDLWLQRTRDSKWRVELIAWADRVSNARPADPERNVAQPR
jgi:hypothetical protein